MAYIETVIAKLLGLEKDTGPFRGQLIRACFDAVVLDVLAELREHKGPVTGGGREGFHFLNREIRCLFRGDERQDTAAVEFLPNLGEGFGEPLLDPELRFPRK